MITKLIKLLLLALAALNLTTALAGQMPKPKAVLSDEFHFYAEFPDEPKQTVGELSTRFGSGKSHRWIVEQSDIHYEVSVTDLPDLAIATSPKSLNEYYSAICEDLGERFGKPSCHQGGNDIEDEYGQNFSYKNGTSKFTRVETWLAKQRLYLVFVTYDVKSSQADQQSVQIRDFMDHFLLIHKSEDGKKYKGGLPTTASQNLKTPDH